MLPFIEENLKEIRVSDNFILSEVCHSDTADREHIDNIPPINTIIRLGISANAILEPVRRVVNRPMTEADITSAYRCIELNRRLGSKDTSDHVKGNAYDIRPRDISLWRLAQWMRLHIEFDQLILEKHGNGDDKGKGWIHCSYRSALDNRKQVLTYDGQTYKEGLHLYDE